jgi:hypothetical protein
MTAGSSQEDGSAAPGSLRISFAAGERPYMFWVSHWTRQPEGRLRFKVLSKSFPDRSLEVLVLAEGTRALRRPMASLHVSPDFPTGWLEHWIQTLATELGTRFELFDLRSIESAEEWWAIARRLGWTLSSDQHSAA